MVGRLDPLGRSRQCSDVCRTRRTSHDPTLLRGASTPQGLSVRPVTSISRDHAVHDVCGRLVQTSRSVQGQSKRELEDAISSISPGARKSYEVDIQVGDYCRVDIKHDETGQMCVL